MKNPFSLTFGMKPANFIDRLRDRSQIIEDFSADAPANYVYVLTGVRGSGKSVFMYSIANELRAKDDWIVANIGPKNHILEAVAAEIYSQAKLRHLFLKGEFSVSFKGFGISLQGKEPISDVMTLLKRLLAYLEKKGKKVLVIIDEVDNSNAMKYFVQGYASLLGEGYRLRLLMTGLYENISRLRNNKSLTFLYRAPRIAIGPLPIGSVAAKYMDLLKVDEETSLSLAKITKGYAYAYQVLGYYLFEMGKGKADQDVFLAFDQQLNEFVYEKLYSERSPMAKNILKAMESDRPIKTSELSEKLDKTASYLSSYRDDLIKEGILYSPSYGYIQFALPRFDVFLKTK